MWSERDGSRAYIDNELRFMASVVTIDLPAARRSMARLLEEEDWPVLG